MSDIYQQPLARSFVAASSQYLQASQSLFVTNGPFTMACWFMSNDDASLQTLMSLQRSTSFERGYAMVADGATASDPVRFRYFNGSVAYVTTTTGYTVNRWHHAMCTHTSTAFPTSEVYIDGGCGASATTTMISGNMDVICIGRGIASGAGQNHMSGNILWPAVWNIALDAADRRKLASGECPLNVHPESLVMFWDWSGRGLEISQGQSPGAYSLTNNGSSPISVPIPLRTLIARESSFGALTGNRRRRLLLCG